MHNDIDLTGLQSLRAMVDHAAENYFSARFATFRTPDGVRSKTYGDFKRDTRGVASYLCGRGLIGAHAAIISANSYEWLAAFFGVVSAGAVAVPLNIGETPETLERLTLFADCEIVFFDEKRRAVAERLKGSGKIKLFVSLDDRASDGETDLSELLAGSGAFLPAIAPDDLCSIIYTSGTTGMPKGVMLSHKNYIYSATSVHVACPTTSLLCILPLSHAFCFTAVITKGIVKGKEIFMNDSMENLMENIRLFKPESMAVVPQIAKRLMFGALKFASMHPEMSEQAAVKAFFGGKIIDIISGGAPLESELAIRFEKTGVLVLNGYGMTECAPIISNNATYQHRAGSVGKPIPCMDVVIRDSQILVKGPSVFKGYYKNPEETKAAFTEDGYFMTGDTGYFDNDGYLYLNGRVKNLILLDNGENVSAEQLEALFGYEKFVKEVVCYGEGSAIVAEIFPDKEYIEANGIKDVDAYMLEMLQRVNADLAVFQRISKYVLRDTPFPKNASMKIKRDGVHGAVREKKEPAATDTEKKIVAAVRELLHIDDIGRDDNFFALGGNSLNAAELAAELNIPQELIYENPFISVLAAKLEERADVTEKEEDLKVNDLIPGGKYPKGGEIKTVLLTGAGGFLGVHVLGELLRRGVRVYALVRNVERFGRSVDRYLPEFAGSGLIEPIVGNIEKDLLGLTSELYDKLVSECGAVFHCAASVLHAGDYKLSYRTNVTGSLNAAKLAMAADCPFEYCSTVSLHGAGTVRERRKDPVFDEDTLYIGQIYADNVYIHSKFEAERELLKLKQDGLKLNIFRMGNLTWRQSDGMFQRNAADNGFLHRLRAILKLGVYSDANDKYPIDFTPIDRSAEAVVGLALATGAGEIYHIINPNYVPTERLFALTGRKGVKVTSCESIETVAANSDDRDVSVFEFYSIVSASSDEVELKVDKTIAALRGIGFEWNEIDAEYLAKAEELLDVSGFTPKAPSGGGRLNHIQRLFLGKLSDAKTVPQELMTGAGSVAKLRQTLKQCRNPFVVTFPEIFANETVMAALNEFESYYSFTEIKGEPSTALCRRAVGLFVENGCDGVIAIGGGSVLDCAKLLCLGAANPDREFEELCRLYRRGTPRMPFTAVPTTAGTGSEVTLFAVVTNDKGKKHPFASGEFLPDTVILDPTLTFSVPKRSTAYTAIDALSHAVESYCSLYADTFASDVERAPGAVAAVFGNLPKALEAPDDLEARTALQTAAYEAGLSFRHASTGYVHAVAHRLGELYHVPHGLAIAKAFVPVLRRSAPYIDARLAKLARESGVVSEDVGDAEAARLFADRLEEFIRLTAPETADLKVEPKDIPLIVEDAQDEAKITGYPAWFSDGKLEEMLVGL